MKSIYTVLAILTVGNEYTFTEYMSLSKSDIIDKFLSFERNGFEIQRAKLLIGEHEVNLGNYSDLYSFVGNLNDNLVCSMSR